MESIQLSALGRNVHVGDLYNYSTDAILPSKCSITSLFWLLSNTGRHEGALGRGGAGRDGPVFSYY